MAKGIRVNLLAKELGIESKVILEKCRQEGLADKVPNHQSTIALGLAETIRGWHASGDLDALIKLHVPSESALKKKKPASKKSDSATDGGGDDEGGVATLVDESPEPSTTETKAPAPKAKVAAKRAKTVEEEAADAAVAAEPEPTKVEVPVEAKAPEVEVPATPVEKPVDVPVAPVIQQPEASVAPVTPSATVTPMATVVAPTPPATPIAKAVAPKSAHSHQQARPTVKLEARTGLAKPERPRIEPAPFVPKKAEIAGPKVVREEQPDVVSAPRKKSSGPSGGGHSQGGTGVTPVQARGGRGVRVSEEDDEAEKKKKAGGAAARRRGPDGRRGEADEKLREFSEQDLKDRAERILAASAARQATDRHLTKTETRGTHAQARTAAQRGGILEIEEPITVRTLSTELGIKTNDIIGRLMKQGVFANINQALDYETAQLLALQFNIELKIKAKPSLEDILMAEFDSRESEPENIKPRSPIVTILGHVDHGKTSLLDKIRSANVAAGEAGGITQHIAAWQVHVGGKHVTFIDTPGHQAFTAMRARGANMTDVVVLVVSAAEGVQPQTVESINHAKAAGVPIIVAMNKIDRADANPDMILGQLAANGLNPTEWGGDTEVCRVSALTGQGIPELIEVLDYQTQLRDLKGDSTGPARGTVIESRMDAGHGPIATVLVQNGTLKVGDVVLAGVGWGKVRSLLDDQFKPVQTAGPSTPIVIAGMSELPQAGDKFYVVDNADRARAITQERIDMARATQLAERGKVSLDSLYGQMKDSAIKTINLIIKADMQGSVETLQKTVIDQNTEEVRVKVIHAAAGAINESDVELADASKAVIIGFHVVPDDAARAMAEQRRIEIRTYRVIYEIFDDLKKALSGMLAPEIREKLHGHLEIRQVFKVSKIGSIGGCMVTDGHVQRGSKLRLIRDGKIITEDLTIETLKRVKDDVKEVKQGFECGLKIAGYDDIKIGDRLEAYIRETIQRTL